jgi:hypothetical protein
VGFGIPGTTLGFQSAIVNTTRFDGADISKSPSFVSQVESGRVALRPFERFLILNPSTISFFFCNNFGNDFFLHGQVLDWRSVLRPSANTCEVGHIAFEYSSTMLSDMGPGASVGQTSERGLRQETAKKKIPETEGAAGFAYAIENFHLKIVRHLQSTLWPKLTSSVFPPFISVMSLPVLSPERDP